MHDNVHLLTGEEKMQLEAACQDVPRKTRLVSFDLNSGKDQSYS